MNPSQVNQETSAAQAQGAALQNQYNKQAGQQYSAYQGTQKQANSAYNNLLGYTKSMADPAQLYSQYLGNAQQMYGFNPQDLLKANQNLAHTNTQIANLPQAVQQQGNYYGTTAGAQANNYSQQAGNLQALVAGQSNTANAFQNVLAATQQQANQQAGLGLQGQQLKSQNYQQLYSNATSQMQAAGQTLASIEQLQQQQGSLTSKQVADYRNAYSQYVSSQAAAEQASASMISAQAQASQTNQQVGMANQVSQQISKLYGGNPQQYTQALLGMLTGQNINLPGGATSTSQKKTTTTQPQSANSTPNRASYNAVGQLFKL